MTIGIGAKPDLTPTMEVKNTTVKKNLVHMSEQGKDLRWKRKKKFATIPRYGKDEKRRG